MSEEAQPSCFSSFFHRTHRGSRASKATTGTEDTSHGKPPSSATDSRQTDQLSHGPSSNQTEGMSGRASPSYDPGSLSENELPDGALVIDLRPFRLVRTRADFCGLQGKRGRIGSTYFVLSVGYNGRTPGHFRFACAEDTSYGVITDGTYNTAGGAVVDEEVTILEEKDIPERLDNFQLIAENLSFLEWADRLANLSAAQQYFDQVLGNVLGSTRDVPKIRQWIVGEATENRAAYPRIGRTLAGFLPDSTHNRQTYPPEVRLKGGES